MKLLLPYAHDINGNLVHIDDAQKGQKYTCPNCGAELLLKISKIPEGQKYHRRNRFAHKGISDNHCSESFLHKLFKERCAEYIYEKIAAQEDLFFEWKCEKCYENHKNNLLENVKFIHLEYNLGNCRPDIALVDDGGNLEYVIEVVVTHKPNDKVREYYENNNIPCLQIKVEDFADCKNIAEKLSHPNAASNILCPPRFNRIEFKRPQKSQRQIHLQPTNTYTDLAEFLVKQGNKTCKKCGKAMRIKKDWCDQPFLQCKNPECDYKETLSDYDHIIFSQRK